MLLNEVFDKYNLDINKLLDYGFIKDGKYYVYKNELIDDLYVLFKIRDKEFILDVCDNEDNLFIPFTIKNNVGNYVSKVRKIVNDIKEDILTNCFTSNNYKDKILSYVHKKYKTKEEYPWDDDNFTLKVNNKWYLIYMVVKYKSLNINKEGNIEIINVKLDPNEIEELINNKNFYPAYHMNKKYWMSILLDNNIDIAIVTNLIDQSYENVSKKINMKGNNYEK